MNIKEPKKIETSVCANLNRLDNVWTPAKERFSHFDLYTKEPLEDGTFAICEVKSRSKKYFDMGTLIIEIEKIDWMLEEKAKALEKGKELRLYLCCTNGRSIKAKQFLYDVDDILATANKINLNTQYQTYGDKTKKPTDFYQFPIDIYTIELTEQTLGYNHASEQQ